MLSHIYSKQWGGGFDVIGACNCLGRLLISSSDSIDIVVWLTKLDDLLVPLLQYLIVIEQGFCPIIQEIVVAHATEGEWEERPEVDVWLSEGGLPSCVPFLKSKKHGEGADSEAERSEERRYAAPPD